MNDNVFSRRQALFAAAGAGVAAAAGCSAAETGGNAAGSAGSSPSGAGNGLAAADGACILTPEATEGPYYIDPRLERADIRGGKTGVSLRLRIQVVEQAGCAPVAGARVDIWHADAAGNYSAFDAQSRTAGGATSANRTTYLRGHQMTGADGAASFTTIWPGWYHGRTAHIHFKVWLQDNTVLTAQIYLPDALNEFIYTRLPAYRRSDERDTLNGTDMIARSAGASAFAAVKEQSDHYLASLLVGIDRNARSARENGPGGPPPGGPPPGGPPAGGPPPQGGERGPPGERGGTAVLTGDARLSTLVPGDQP